MILKKILILNLPLILFLSLSCATKEAPTPLPNVGAPALFEEKVIAKEPWEKEWEKIQLEARKEGRVVFSTGTITSDFRQLMVNQMRDKYGIEAEAYPSTSRILQKVLAEHRAGLYQYDLALGGSGTLFTLRDEGVLQPIEPNLILPDVKDPQVWWRGGLNFIDKERKFVLATIGHVDSPVVVNKNLVRKDEIQSYYDLLNPKWKGKIVMNDISRGGTGGKDFAYMLESFGMDYIKKLAEQDIMFSSDLYILGQWLATGKKAIGIGLYSIGVRFIKEGAPLVHITPKEGSYLYSGSANLVIYKNAPHPRAAQVFVNWFLTKEGQLLFSKDRLQQSARIDVPTDHLPPEAIRRPGVNYINRSGEEYAKSDKEYEKLAGEVFKIR